MRTLIHAWRSKPLSSFLALVLATTALVGLPLVASAHHITGAVKVDCDHGTVSVSVASWSGNVEITRTSPLPVLVTHKLPPSSTSTVVFSIAEIGGNGSYKAGRQGFPNDPPPVAFTVACAPSFTLAKTVAEGDASTVPVNSVLHYTVMLHNSSVYTGAAPTITDTISGTAPYSVISGPTASQGVVTGSASPWSWAPGVLAGGGNATLTLNIRVTGDGSIINTAANGQDRHSVHNDVHTPAGTLSGDIQMCDGTHVDGGTIGATGPTNVPPQTNSMSAAVKPGTYAEQATSPVHYHFVACHGFSGSGSSAGISGINVPDAGRGTAIFYVAQDSGTLTGVILFCSADGGAGSAASGTITIPGTSAASGAPAPATVSTAPGTYAVTASNAPSGNRFVNCGAGGGTVSADKGSAGQSAVVTPDNNTTVTFYVQAIPAQGVSGVSSGPTQAAGVLGAATTQPNTGRSELGTSMMIALAMTMLGLALLLRRRFYGPSSDR